MPHTNLPVCVAHTRLNRVLFGFVIVPHGNGFLGSCGVALLEIGLFPRGAGDVPKDFVVGRVP